MQTQLIIQYTAIHVSCLILVDPYYSIIFIVIVTSMSHTTNAIAFKENERRNTSV